MIAGFLVKRLALSPPSMPTLPFPLLKSSLVPLYYYRDSYPKDSYPKDSYPMVNTPLIFQFMSHFDQYFPLPNLHLLSFWPR